MWCRMGLPESWELADAGSPLASGGDVQRGQIRQPQRPALGSPLSECGGSMLSHLGKLQPPEGSSCAELPMQAPSRAQPALGCSLGLWVENRVVGLGRVGGELVDGWRVAVRLSVPGLQPASSPRVCGMGEAVRKGPGGIPGWGPLWSATGVFYVCWWQTGRS